MVAQYPHTGKAFAGSDTTMDSDGNYAEGALELILKTKCRAEPARNNQYLPGSDGKQITFSSIVYMPIPCEVLSVGMLFEVWEGERLIVKEPIKQFSKGQLNARVWL